MSSLDRPAVVDLIEGAVSAHLKRRWHATAFTDLAARSSHHAGVFHGDGLDVFAKLTRAADGATRFAAELAGLALLRDRAGVRVPRPIGAGLVDVGQGGLLLSEAIPERVGAERTDADWDALGRTLAALHAVTGEACGGDADGFFGPLPQDNRPLASWREFFVVRRLLPRLRGAVDAGWLPPDLAAGLERLAARVPELDGAPSLLHGDAQQNNFLCAATGCVVIDPAPFFGHPEYDLALVELFAPVPRRVFDAYAEAAPLADDVPVRRELWRLPAYLAIVEVSGHSAFGTQTLARLAAAVAAYA